MWARWNLFHVNQFDWKLTLHYVQAVSKLMCSCKDYSSFLLFKWIDRFYTMYSYKNYSRLPSLIYKLIGCFCIRRALASNWLGSSSAKGKCLKWETGLWSLASRTYKSDLRWSYLWILLTTISSCHRELHRRCCRRPRSPLLINRIVSCTSSRVQLKVIINAFIFFKCSWKIKNDYK